MTRALIMLVTVSLLAGCGLKGDLDRPAPMWGDARARYLHDQEIERQRKEREQQQQQHAAPGNVVSPNAPTATPGTVSPPQPQPQ